MILASPFPSHQTSLLLGCTLWMCALDHPGKRNDWQGEAKNKESWTALEKNEWTMIGKETQKNCRFYSKSRSQKIPEIFQECELHRKRKGRSCAPPVLNNFAFQFFLFPILLLVRLAVQDAKPRGARHMWEYNFGTWVLFIMVLGMSKKRKKWPYIKYYVLYT